jgi:large subunit ribosomal protein L25
MTDSIALVAQKRDVTATKAAQLRNEGKIPAVIYGQGSDAMAITLDAAEFGKLYARAGQSTILEVSVEGEGVKNVLVQDVQNHLHSEYPIHADLYTVKMDEVVKTSVPLHFTGESTAVFQDGGSLLTAIDELEIECLPGKLPASIEVDIAVLDDFEKTITVADLKVPAGVEVLTDAEELVAKVEAPRSEEELEELDQEVGDAVPAEEGEEAAEGAEGDKPEGEAKEA